MANRQSVLRESARQAEWILHEIGRELRVARLIAGMTLVDVAAQLGMSYSHVSRVEHGLIRGIGIPAVTRHAATVGLKPYLKLYPAISRPLDAAQLALFARLKERIHAGWHIQLEVPMPRLGDLRAADAVLTTHGCRCMIEVITRLADFQAQLRSAHLKQRDLNADRLVLVVAATATNRRALRLADAAVKSALPLDTRQTMRHLAAGTEPGADGLVLL
jgi:transcriptional regulator with XRE-family HTH domain